uniref:Uncharacterized protein n=1 Tax=Candidatus Kentrum sp. SD TaxID=2126332 RepID=A0A450Z743_9GAMM|nr:MAG: hypothetical protein BECKSD772F_GA0070984_11843 [Candidatus Kentron sp. SD]VFK49508.1 MAG: hypothetical protein BECKSD772E_GA0070983_11843 [Candidatus Kentron sp. SD]VFK80991.1 MAG: hypothetical protein BECKSD772D_GA0070982_11923 [Candidatus Kentron sp. SD]
MQITARPLNRRVTIELPLALCNELVEITVLPVSDSKTRNKRTKRRVPPPELASTAIRDDLIAPAVEPNEWNVLQ